MRKSPVGGLCGSGRGHGIWMNTHIHKCPWCNKKRSLSHVELYSL